MSGWIKLHRDLKDWRYGKNMEMLGLWSYVLLSANHKDNFDNTGLLIKKGSFKTGRKRLSEETGLSESKIERLLKKLEDAQQIEQQKTTKYRIITVTKWLDYQSGEQQVNNKRTTSEQQVNTNKNEKKEKNEKNNSALFSDIVSYLNSVTGKTYKPSTKTIQALIKARINDGFNLEDFKYVIDVKNQEWGEDPKMSKFVRPSTLFGTKFSEYRQENKKLTNKQWQSDFAKLMTEGFNK